MTAPVDVLAVMDAIANGVHPTRHATEYVALTNARAAVAELIEADKEYDEARADFDSAFRPATHTNTGRAPKHSDPRVVRYHVAVMRRAAALARVGGAR